MSNEQDQKQHPAADVNASNYVQNVLRTGSGDMEPILARLRDEQLAAVLFEAMAEVVQAAEVIDACKKNIFYGKPSELLDQRKEYAEFDNLRSELDYRKEYYDSTATIMARLLEPKVIRMTHAAVGMATEAGELIDMLRTHVMYGERFDDVNAGEEIGDSLWYAGLGSDVLGLTIEDIMQTNIAKLRKRFPVKFTEDAAINRDTDAERELLEELHEDSFLHLNIKCCSRCGENHGDVPALPLDRTSDEWSHYALCPTNGQPIMIATAEGDYVLLEDALEKAFEAICSGDGSDMKAYLRVLMVAMRPAWFDEHGDPVAMEDK